MALVLKDRVQETTTTTGTGTLTLDGAVTGYQAFTAIGNANTTYYAIYALGGTEWEVGLGTYTASGTTLSRNTVLASSNSGSLVSFSAGTKNVWCDYPAGKAVYTDANGEITGTTINANTKFVSENYYAQSVLGGNLRTSSGTSLVNWDGGGSGNVTFNGGISASPANKNIVLSPSGIGVVTINPATAGSMNNIVIGATTPAAITGTTVTATTFSGSGASLTSIPNSALNNSAITINGTSTSLGGSISVGTVTSVTGTSPVVSSGGATPAISIPAATTSVSGYLTSTDWNTFNNKGSGTITAVSATAPITSSGGTTPNLAMPAATTSVSGYLTSTDWTTFNNKGSGTVTSVSATAPITSTGGTTPNLAMPAATISVNGYLTSTDFTTFNNKQATLVSGTNIKTINTNSILGSGDLTISASAAGSTTQVQYNSSGSFAGSSNLTFDGTNLTVAGNTTTSKLTIGTTQLGAGNATNFKNRIINGDMRIDQRNAGASQTFTAAAALAYSVDRWYGYCTGANVTGQQIAGTYATSQNQYQFTGAASVTTIGFGQRIESKNSYDLANKTATLSCYISNSLLTTVTWTASYATTTADTFGSLASPTVTQIATGTFTVSSTRTQYSTNISIPSAATTGIQIIFSVGAQTSGTWIIDTVQLEVGSSATGFEYRDYGNQLTQCQRYYYLLGSGSSITTASGYCVTTAQYNAAITFPTQLRASPTLISTYSSGYYTLDALGSPSLGAFAIYLPTKFSAVIYSATTAAFGGLAAAVIFNNAACYIGFSAEL